MSRPRRERRSVVAVEAVGPYALVRVDAGLPRSGHPRAVLHARGARAACCRGRCRSASRRAASSRSCSTRSGPGRRRSPHSSRATRSTSSARSATASGSTSRGRCSSAAASASHRSRISSEALEHPPAVLGFRSEHHAEAAALDAERRGRDRPGARHRCDARSVATCSRAGPSRCSKRCARSRPTRSSRGRRRWPAGTARATAASSRSTAS